MLNSTRCREAGRSPACFENRLIQIICGLFCFAIITTLATGCTLPMLLAARAREEWRPAASEYIFDIEPGLPFLGEELAVSKARTILVSEGYSSSDWGLTLTFGSETKAHDGRRDKFVQHRSGSAPDERVLVRFTNMGRFRLYHVSLEEQGHRLRILSYGTQRDAESWSSRPKANPQVRHGKRLLE